MANRVTYTSSDESPFLWVCGNRSNLLCAYIYSVCAQTVQEKFGMMKNYCCVKV